MLKILTFGGLNITHNTTSVNTLITRKVEALLVYLMCTPRECSREFLGAFLWDDLPQNRTMGNLRTAISNLNQTLGDYLQVSRHTIAFDVCQLHWIDVGQLDNAIQQGKQHRQVFGTLSRPIAKQIAEAVQLYQGDFLSGFYIKNGQGFEEWKLHRQEYYRQQTVLGLQWLVDYHIEQQQYIKAIEYALRLLEINPLLEEGHRYLMQLYSLTDQRTAALVQYNQCVDILHNELAVEPDQTTRTLYQRILMKTADERPQTRSDHNLPSPLTPFVPRPELLSQIVTQLQTPSCSLLTLVGMGGTGKTRLALQAGHDLLDRYPDGVYFIDLVGMTSSSVIPSVIANALEIVNQSDSTLQQDVFTFLQKKRLLLIFDNFEDCLDAADFIAELLTKAPTVKMLVTSRERLNLYGEWVLHIEGFSLPARADQTHDSPPIQLFLNTARRVSPSFTVEGNQDAILDICHRVEGLPLAIELAASWVHLMPCQDIAEQIKHDIKVLEAPLKNLPVRHRGIWALFESSWQSLTPKEQHVLLRLSLFRSRFDFNAAAQAGQASLSVLGLLSDKCLLKVLEPGWYTIHSLLKHYIADKLADNAFRTEAYDQYARYFLGWIPHQTPSQIDPYYDDIRGLLAHDDGKWLIPFCRVLGTYWHKKGYLNESRHWLTLSLMQPNLTSEQRAMSLAKLGEIAWAQSDFDVAEGHMREALPLLEAHELWLEYCQTLNHLGHLNLNRGDFAAARMYYERILYQEFTPQTEELYALALGNLGMLHSDLSDFEAAAGYLLRSIEINRRLGNQGRTATLLSNLGTVVLAQGENQTAKRYYDEAYDLAKRLENVVMMMICQINLGEVSHNLGDYALAAQYYREGLKILETFGDKLALVGTLESIAYLLIDLRQAQFALQVLGTTQAAREALSAPMAPREIPRLDRYLEKARAELEASHKMSAQEPWPSIDDVVAEVLTQLMVITS